MKLKVHHNVIEKKKLILKRRLTEKVIKLWKKGGFKISKKALLLCLKKYSRLETYLKEKKHLLGK